MIRAALYVRVSTREQAEEGYSVGAQLEKMKLYCMSRDWTIVDDYVDGGFSGSNLDRPAMRSLIFDAFKGKMDMVLVYKLDRLSRSQKDTLYLIEEVFNANGVNFTSMQENFDTSTPLGMAMVGILSVFAQLERSQIAERMMMGKDAKVKEGHYLGHARAPIGYDYDPVGGGLFPIENEASQVKEIFKLFTEENRSISSIQKYMNSHYSTRYGNYTADSTIRKILSNPVYTGRFTYKGKIYASSHVPIIDDATFEKAEYLLAARRNKNSSAFAGTTLLSGILWCGKCGSRFGGTTHQHQSDKMKYAKTVYSCYARKRNHKSCNMRFLGRDEVENLVWDEILSLNNKEIDDCINTWKDTERFEEIRTLIENASEVKANGSTEEQRELVNAMIEKITVFQKCIKIKFRFRLRCRVISC